MALGDDEATLLAELRAGGLERGGWLAIVIAPGVGCGLAIATESQPHRARAQIARRTTEPATLVTLIERTFQPRWVWWSRNTATDLVAAGVRVARCWDVDAVHRLLFGGWRAGCARVWAALHGLTTESIPGMGQLDLLGGGGDEGGDVDEPVRPDGHLRPEWVAGGWTSSAARLARWAALTATACDLQRARLRELAPSVLGDPEATARAESAAELLCTELMFDGLPLDVDEAAQIIGSYIGPRPANEAEALAARQRRDRRVLDHDAGGGLIDLRNPSQVRALLRRVGVDVPDTRAWRLEPFRDVHPVVDALLTWRKAERLATTYGYGWLDEHVGADGRLRGEWTGSDGAAGRMTAQAGLHNMPAELRGAVIAEPGRVLVRADLGQIEPRVLAAVSGDDALLRATMADDLYAPVASRLGVERAIAKVAVLAAMYGQTSGTAGQALRGLDAAYPVAMRYLRDAEDAGRLGRDVRTFGGRLVRMGADPDATDPRQERAALAARGRYARNAVVQGAAAELFKVWAVTVRARVAPFDARIVLCLHDELLIHAPVEHGPAVAALVDDCLHDAARRWSAGRAVRFVTSTSIIARWSDA